MTTTNDDDLRAAAERLHERLLEVYGRAYLCRPPTASMDSLAELLDEFDALLAEHPAPEPPRGDHPYIDPRDGRTECYLCGKFVHDVTHSCKGVPVTRAAEARVRGLIDAVRAEHPATERDCNGGALGSSCECQTVSDCPTTAPLLPSGGEVTADELVEVIAAEVWRIHGPESTDEESAQADGHDIAAAILARFNVRRKP